MRRAADAPVESRAAEVARHAEKFVKFWHQTGSVHFRDEEEVLLPAYARFTRLDQDAGAMKMLADHAEIRATVQDFEQLLAAKLVVEPAVMARLATLLHDHVRLEENELFPRIEKALGEQQLHAMGRDLRQLHSKIDACDI